MSKKQVIVQNLPKYTGVGRLIAIGDIHGCLDELVDLVHRLNLQPADTLIPLGDLVDRGPDSNGAIQFIIALQNTCKVHAILGNHDSKVVRYHNHVLKYRADPAYKIPMRVPHSYQSLSESSLAYLGGLPHAVFVEGVDGEGICFVHAGMTPGAFHQDPEAFIRNRYFIRNVADGRLTPVKSVEIGGVWHVPEGSEPWYRFWDGRWVVVYGHIVNFSPVVVGKTIGIDTGCCFGGSLTAWVKERHTSGFVSVPSSFNYNKKP